MALEPEDSTADRTACDFVRDNADAFALGALTPEESQRIVQHVGDHPECQPIVSAAVAVASALAYSMPLIDRPDLAVKLRLFDRVAAESAQSTANVSRIETSDRVIAALNAQAPALPVRAEIPPRRSWIQHVSTALIAPLAIALTIMSLWAYNLNDELDDMRESTEASEGVASNTIEMWTMETSDSSSNARGSLGALPDETSAVLLAWNLDPEEELEVWCEEENGNKWMVSPLEVGDDGAAMQTINLPKSLDEYKSIYVSGGEGSGSETPELMLTLPEKTKPDPHDDIATPTW